MWLGKGFIVIISRGQKLHDRRSTESKIISVNDTPPQVFCTIYFTKAQGYTTGDVILKQDNMRTSILENNVKWSSTKQKNNICGRYFFIKDRTKTAEISVEYSNIKGIITD